jgi:type II secretory pathway pseudopilin PulG
MRIPRSFQKSQGGFSLVTAMVGMALTGIAASAFINLSSISNRATKSSSLRLDLQDAHRAVHEKLNCAKTMARFAARDPSIVMPL